MISFTIFRFLFISFIFFIVLKVISSYNINKKVTLQVEGFMIDKKMIRKLRLKKGMSQKELAKELEVDPAYISRLETVNDKDITTKKLVKLAKALGTTPDYLLSFSEINNNSDFYEVVKNDEGFIKVPVYGTVPAGQPIEALEVDEGYVDIPGCMFKGGKRLIGLKVKGDSMYPYYLEGDVVIIEITTDCNSGDDVVVFIGYDHEATLKRIHKKQDLIELEPLNRMYSPMKFTPQDEPIRVLGVVRQLIRNVS